MVEPEALRPTRRTFSFDTAAYWLVVVSALVLPFLLIPHWGQSLDVVKRLWLSVAIFATILLWLVGRLEQGKISLPRSPLLLAAAVIFVVTIISAILASPLRLGLWGDSFAWGTAWSMLAGMALVLLGATYLSGERRVVSFYGLTAISLFVLLVGQLMLLLIAPLRELVGVIGAPTLVGNWNDLGAFAGLGLLAVTSCLELLRPTLSRPWRLFGWATIMLSLLALVVINVILWWWLCALGAVLLFTFFLARERSAPNQARRLLRPIAVVAFASVVYLLIAYSVPLVPQLIGETSVKHGLIIGEVRPAFRPTITTLLATLKESPIVGAGPLQFNRYWLRYGQAAEINLTRFWDLEFESGYSSGLTLAVAGGLLGLLAWAAFLVIFLLSGVQTWLQLYRQPATKPLPLITWVLSLYAWITVWWFVPGTVLWALAFILTGIYIGSQVSLKRITVYTWSLGRESNRSSAWPLVGTLLALIISVVALGFAVRETAAVVYAERGLSGLSRQAPLELVDRHLSTAAQLGAADHTLRLLVEVRLAALEELLRDAESEGDVARLRFKDTAEAAISAARTAIAYHPHRFTNWLALGKVYERLAVVGVSGAPDGALAAYQEAAKLHPTSPLPAFGEARVSLIANNKAAARSALERALELKPNLVPALALLEQVEDGGEFSRRALARLESTVEYFGPDPELWFQLGYQRYRQGHYESAVSAFNQALALESNYSDARYFLIQTYRRLGRTAAAREEFRRLESANPDSPAVRSLSAELNAPVESD